MELICECGNTADDAGFQPCDRNGDEIEPTEYWEGFCSCEVCGRIHKGEE